MESIERILHSPAESETRKLQLAGMKGRTWVTRRGIKVDRMASAWLIRRFIDPAAKFSLVDIANYKHAAHEIRFDMFEGEFTHEGDMCTFEVLLKFKVAGKVGVWTKADSVTLFDDFNYGPK